jgi:hypothetical protein
VEHALELEVAHAALDGLRVSLDVCGSGLVVLALGKAEQLRGVGDGFGGAIELIELGSELGALAAELLSLFRLLPDSGVFQLAIDFL